MILLIFTRDSSSSAAGQFPSTASIRGQSIRTTDRSNHGYSSFLSWPATHGHPGGLIRRHAAAQAGLILVGFEFHSWPNSLFGNHSLLPRRNSPTEVSA